MKKIFLLSIIFCLGLFSTRAQVTLSVDSNTYFNIQDSVNYGSSSIYDVIVNISGPTPYTGDVYLIYGVDSISGVQSLDTLIRSVVNKVNDTIVFSVSETYDNINGYRLGGNVVVIWPVASGITTLDTFYTDVYVRAMVGINENKSLYNDFLIYPNPTQEYLMIKNKGLKNRVEEVRIFDVNGRILYDDRFKSKISISHLNSGMYVLVLKLDNGDRINYQILKE